MDEQIYKRLLAQGRTWMKGNRADDPYRAGFESDQVRRRPQPPLCKPPMAPGNAIALPRDFEALPLCNDVLTLFSIRRSARVYTQEPISLRALSFLLWATQGVQAVRGHAYATLRTVPSGGARHPFETYLLIKNVEGLRPGAYHYLPMTHALEFLSPVHAYDETVCAALGGQAWASRANAVFFWSMVACRAEWRYGFYAHRIALMDAGHLCENLYLACAASGLGACAVAGLSNEACNALFTLDGEEEFIVYAATAGAATPDGEGALPRFAQEDHP